MTADDDLREDEPLRVLVAEDEALIRLDLVELLTEEGYQVIAEASNGEEALELARKLTPDLVVMDVKMPKMDGISAAAIIAEERIAPVVMLTAFSQREIIEQARDAGALAYLVKPFQKSDLVPAIEVAIGRFRELRDLTGEVDALGCVGPDPFEEQFLGGAEVLLRPPQGVVGVEADDIDQIAVPNRHHRTVMGQRWIAFR